MKCSNIILFTDSDPDAEVIANVSLLRERYEINSKVQEIQWDTFVDEGGEAISFSAGDGLPDERDDRATGVFVIIHGSQATGILPPLFGAERVKQFASWLLTLLDKKFRVRKICFITCGGVAVEGEGDQRKAKSIPPESIPLEDNSTVFVQTVCHAISQLPEKELFDGLMIAGYSTGVYLHPEAIEGRPKGFKTTQKDNPQHVMHQLPTIRKDLTKKLQAYARNKMVFVLEKGSWRQGSILEYTDNEGLKAALQKRGVF